MKDNLARNLFERLAKHLRSIDSDIAIKICIHGDKQSIHVKYLNDEWNSWYKCIDINIDLQLFFLGQNLDNRDELLKNNMISTRFSSFFEYALIIDPEDLDAQTYNLLHSIGYSYKSLEELQIKFDLLGI
jgi:hypothetical protein